MNPIEGKVLGKQVSHPKKYSPEILVNVPRKLNREQYEIDNKNLPFVGLDAWHAYELGFLTEKGLPVVGLLKIVYDCQSEFLVESKSLKLYLNSFNMARYGNNSSEGINIVQQIIKKDLSNLLQTQVEVFFHQSNNYHQFDFEDYTLLEKLPEVESTEFITYKENKSLLHGEILNENIEYKLSTNLIRSNCKITHQPDWGSAFIYIDSKYKINEIALLKYLVSIRDENHFHEEICEMIYKRLLDKFNPKYLMVACLYTRRGGIDICPIRANKQELLQSNICKADILTKQAFRQ